MIVSLNYNAGTGATTAPRFRRRRMVSVEARQAGSSGVISQGGITPVFIPEETPSTLTPSAPGIQGPITEITLKSSQAQETPATTTTSVAPSASAPAPQANGAGRLHTMWCISAATAALVLQILLW